MTATAAPPTLWLDSPTQYGRISRILHWSMALLFLWQFTGMVLKVTLGLHPRDSWLLGTHAHVGFVLMVLMVLRAIWAIANIHRRPSYGTGFLARCASLGHAALYLLMLLVPLSALVRSWASGRGFNLFNTIPVLSPGTATPAIGQFINGTRETLGASIHGLLGWLLLLIIVGHIGMVILHHWVWKDGTLHKMLGRKA
ncbi:cytochrome b [Lampropedia puyangensis]|uniref:Cytochrome b n=1 Tax=Lampropedia puyangensis TaxID=1330072 RepID=A0A4S8F6R9_9BURK|nr:cytochrome b/b6 domain-containing protein [Lampropedia puyangensis]THU02777.1 cytochrome b [Lampropedia puyangensis]